MRPSDHPLHRTYEGMIERCNYKKNCRYHRYGGRGIKVCERWARRPDKKALGFWNFVNDMGEKPEGCTLDRIDPDGDYSPENCKWSTALEQARNKSSDRKVRHWLAKLNEDKVRTIRMMASDGQTVNDIARRFEVSPSTVADAIKRRTWKDVN
jgi:DNA-directed RNA polymerase specialized sigma24 family protein